VPVRIGEWLYARDRIDQLEDLWRPGIVDQRYGPKAHSKQEVWTSASCF
jgi:hypothetical protein